MIAIIHDLAIVWICGIPVAFLVFGWIIASAPPLIRFHVLRWPYVFWCVAWPASLAVVAYRTGRQWWQR